MAISMPIQMEYHEGTDKIYVLADQRLGTEDFRAHHTNTFYRNGGFVAYAIDPTKNGNAKPNRQYWTNNGSHYVSLFEYAMYANYFQLI